MASMVINVTRLLALVCMFFIIFTVQTALAHSGRTDSNGGHNCYVGSCAGTYHYHNGGSSNSSPSTPAFTIPEDTYYDGHEAGESYAKSLKLSIELSTKTIAYGDGYSDGKNKRSKNISYPSVNIKCNDIVTSGITKNQNYKDGYKDGYISECQRLAGSASTYNYGLGFDKGVEDQPADYSGWLWLLGIAGFYGFIGGAGYVSDKISYQKSKKNTITEKLTENNSKGKVHTDMKSMKCVRCGGLLKLKHGRYGDFYGCTRYPKCKYTKNK